MPLEGVDHLLRLTLLLLMGASRRCHCLTAAALSSWNFEKTPKLL
jgi:hypothetical protein